METQVLLPLAAAVFVAGVIDSIAGGGGLITVPAYLLAGLPPHLALGTNKLVSSVGTATAVFNYARRGRISPRVVAAGLLFSLGGSALGTRLVLQLDAAVVGRVIVALMPLALAAVLLPRRTVRRGADLTRRELLTRTPPICLGVGFYDGFFGPGTGSFLALGLHAGLRLDLVEATGNAKAFNLLSNLGALVTFALGGQVLLAVGLPLMAVNIAGNYLGSRLALWRGAGFIRVFLAVVLAAVFVVLAGRYWLG